MASSPEGSPTTERVTLQISRVSAGSLEFVVLDIVSLFHTANPLVASFALAPSAFQGRGSNACVPPGYGQPPAHSDRVPYRSAITFMINIFCVGQYVVCIHVQLMAGAEMRFYGLDMQRVKGSWEDGGIGK